MWMIKLYFQLSLFWLKEMVLISWTKFLSMIIIRESKIKNCINIKKKSSRINKDNY
jgi:hypothetical protein